jgi:hypothetical protein
VELYLHPPYAFMTCCSHKDTTACFAKEGGNGGERQSRSEEKIRIKLELRKIHINIQIEANIK